MPVTIGRTVTLQYFPDIVTSFFRSLYFSNLVLVLSIKGPCCITCVATPLLIMQHNIRLVIFKVVTSMDGEVPWDLQIGF